MASGNITKRNTKKGIHYELTVEGERDPETGKRQRYYKTVKGSEKEAKAELRKMITEVEQGEAIRKLPMRVGEWMDQWVEHYLPHVEETTRIGYKTKIKCYIKPALGDILVQSLKGYHVQKMVNDMLARGLAAKNIKDTYNNVNAAMKKAVVLRMIAHNPCEGVSLPKVKRYKAKVYNVTNIHKLLELAQGTDMYLPILLLVSFGLRRGELLALRWSDIDFENKLLKVRSNMVRGEKGYLIKAPKSEAGIRDLHIGDDLLDELKQAREQYLADKLAYGRGFQDLNFVIRQADGSPIMPDSMTRKWVRFVEQHELPHIRLHDLRHSHATALMMAGVNPRVVQQRMGHSDVNITLNTYTHVLPEMDIETAELLDQIMLKKQ